MYCEGNNIWATWEGPKLGKLLIRMKIKWCALIHSPFDVLTNGKCIPSRLWMNTIQIWPSWMKDIYHHLWNDLIRATWVTQAWWDTPYSLSNQPSFHSYNTAWLAFEGKPRKQAISSFFNDEWKRPKKDELLPWLPPRWLFALPFRLGMMQILLSNKQAWELIKHTSPRVSLRTITFV